jgi:hypothetical protein
VKRGDRALVSVGIGAAVTVIAYAALRGVERAFFPEPSPVVVIWSDRSPLVWRAAIACYLGGAAIFGGYALAGRAPRAAGRWLVATTALAAIAIVIQAAIAP